MHTKKIGDIERNTHLGRPWLVLWQNKSERWVVKGYRTQKEAVLKSATLLTSGQTHHTIIAHVLFTENKYE